MNITPHERLAKVKPLYLIPSRLLLLGNWVVDAYFNMLTSPHLSINKLERIFNRLSLLRLH